MPLTCLSQTTHVEHISDGGAVAGSKNQGTLKTDGKDHSVFVLADSEAVTEAAAKFLQEVNQQERPPELLLDFEFTYISPQMVEIEYEIAELLLSLTKTESPKEENKSEPLPPNQMEGKTKQQDGKSDMRFSESKGAATSNAHTSSGGRSEVVYSSLFSLARSLHTTLSESRQKKDAEQKIENRTQEREVGRAITPLSSTTSIVRIAPEENRYDREGNGKQEKGKQEKEQEGSSQNQDPRQERDQPARHDKKKKIVSIANIRAARSNSQKRNASPQASSQGEGAVTNKGGHEPAGSLDNIYIRFMALMARILGQAELEAHQLYLRIKERTDGIDVLTLLITKINSEKGVIDWTNNEEMKKLIEKARALGVDIPEGKYTWSEEEKKLLKENIQMRKDSMEKMTQLERTDMQRYLQEASQCHQARSNVLKLLKEVTDTIIANMRAS